MRLVRPLLLLTLACPSVTAQVTDTGFAATAVELPGEGDFTRRLDSLQRLDPKQEVRLALSRGDRRFLALEEGGISGVPDSVALLAFHQGAFRRIPWTGDYSTGREHDRWHKLAAAYSRRYNAYLWARLLAK